MRLISPSPGSRHCRPPHAMGRPSRYPRTYSTPSRRAYGTDPSWAASSALLLGQELPQVGIGGRRRRDEHRATLVDVRFRRITGLIGRSLTGRSLVGWTLVRRALAARLAG